jgi:hypothetical protein
MNTNGISFGVEEPATGRREKREIEGEEQDQIKLYVYMKSS